MNVAVIVGDWGKMMQAFVDSLLADWSKGDALALIGSLLSLVAIVLALWGWSIRAWLTERRLVTKFGADLYLREDIRNATRYYLRPDATSVDLAQEMDEGNIIATRESLFKATDRFLEEESPHRHMLLLADSGMGKSSFVLNYYDYNRRKWGRRHKLAVIPLGAESALEKIKEIKNQNETILFLDAFDEDPEARNSYEKRLSELMKACVEFKRVLITCRTQYFPKEDAIPNISRLVLAPRGGKAQHTFWRLYIAPFSDRQVNTYLRRRFNFWSFGKKRKAREMAAKVPKLTVRPMLLLHIPDLLQAQIPVRTTWDIYQILTEKWYERELGFWKETEALRQFSEEVAIQFYLKFRRDGSDRVSRETVASIVEQQKDSLEKIDASLKELAHWNAAVRSLLHRDAAGNWKFAHRSIMEFLFVKKFFEGEDRCRGIQWTDQMKKFFAERIATESNAIPIGALIGANLTAADLKGANLGGAELSGADLSRSNFIQADLSESNLSKATFIRASFGDADLHLANLDGAVLNAASFIGANLSEATLKEATLRGTILIFANLRAAHLGGADLSHSNLSHADLRDADLSGANLSGVNFSGANLTGANLAGADIRGANLSGLQHSQYIKTLTSPESKLKEAKQLKKTNYGLVYQNKAEKSQDVQIETPVGNFIYHSDGTFSDVTNKLMWIRALWGMTFNGDEFEGEPIKLNWNDATKLFGFGGTIPCPKGALRYNDIRLYRRSEYKRGSCTVEFAGYSDWRLPTAEEILPICFCYEPENYWEPRGAKYEGYSHNWDTKAKELQEKLFPALSNRVITSWSANDRGGDEAWCFDGQSSLGDYYKHIEYPILFVRNL